MDSIEQVRAFAEAINLDGKWSAARQLMSSKVKPSGETFYSLLEQAFDSLVSIARVGEDAHKLIALDLLVRVPASMKNNKRVQAMALEARRESVSAPLPPLSIVSEKKALPDTAKPAEIRENVAEALNDAQGDWVVPYLFRSLAEEDRSQRCRLALAREIARRDPLIDDWFERLLREPSLNAVPLDVAAGRLKDLCEALIEAVRSRRTSLVVSPKSGQLLATFTRSLVSLGAQLNRPKGLDVAAAAAIGLLNEILAVRLTIMDEPDLYDLIPVLHRWWVPRPYPEAVSQALSSIIDKIVAGLVFRARGGQTSEVLRQRLKQGTNNEELYRGRIQQILDSESGLVGNIQDWLRGVERRPERRQDSVALSEVGAESFVRQLAELYRLAVDERDSGSNSHLTTAILSLASTYGLSSIGAEGDLVEYSPNVFDLPHGEFPRERSVRIVRSPIVRRRYDGGSDVILRGLAATT